MPASPLMSTKSALRQHISERVAQISPNARAEASVLLRTDVIAALTVAQPIAAYMALPDEISCEKICEIWWQAGRPVWLPRVREASLTWHPITHRDQLIPGFRDILEPDETACPAMPLPPRCQVLVPGRAFTADGQRLGRGGGYYDRALSAVRAQAATCIGVAYRCQLVESLPVEAHDVAMDRVIAV